MTESDGTGVFWSELDSEAQQAAIWAQYISHCAVAKQLDDGRWQVRIDSHIIGLPEDERKQWRRICDVEYPEGYEPPSYDYEYYRYQNLWHYDNVVGTPPWLTVKFPEYVAFELSRKREVE